MSRRGSEDARVTLVPRSRLRMPRVCACCLGTPETAVVIKHREQYDTGERNHRGAKIMATEETSFELPACAGCATHHGLAGAAWLALGAALALLLSMWLPLGDGAAVLVARAALVLVAVVELADVARRARSRRAACGGGSSVARLQLLDGYHVIQFANARFAAQVRELNRPRDA